MTFIIIKRKKNFKIGITCFGMRKQNVWKKKKRKRFS